MSWPKRGVYFFREPGENRKDTGAGPRIVRAGTHALKSGSGTKLWTRLSQHKGQQATGGGDGRYECIYLRPPRTVEPTIKSFCINRGIPQRSWTFTVSETLGFGSLVCFCLGYIVLIFLVTR